MLMPKRVKYRRVQRGRMKGKASRGNVISNGTYDGFTYTGTAEQTDFTALWIRC